MFFQENQKREVKAQLYWQWLSLKSIIFRVCIFIWKFDLKKKKIRSDSDPVLYFKMILILPFETLNLVRYSYNMQSSLKTVKNMNIFRHEN
jgi:hypothetical protein